MFQLEIMGKRGPRPKGEYGGKGGRTAVLSTRLQPDSRARLVAAAKTNGRSLSQELEHRLRRTFTEDDKAVDWYGSGQTAAVVKLIGATIHSAAARVSKRGKHDWLEEQWLFDDVMDAIAHVLLWFRPGGDSGRRPIALSSGTNEADTLMEEIRSADPSLPIAKGSTRQHALAMLKDKLGDLAKGPHPYEDWQKREPPVRIVVPRPAKRREKK
jgi:CelD/BcsL family acetyltransferase involved in cellulose biosynthesis